MVVGLIKSSRCTHLRKVVVRFHFPIFGMSNLEGLVRQSGGDNLQIRPLYDCKYTD